MTTKTEAWKASYTASANYLCTLEIGGEHVFEVLATGTRLVFGGACNAGFLESGFMRLDGEQTTNEALGELIDELEAWYRDGADFTNRIVCNDRM